MPKIALIALLGILPFPTHAQPHAHDYHDAPIEAGQAAFAAVAEIVMLLENDPDTDWATVNIDALRRHLIDMDRVMLEADVKVEAIENGARFTARGDGAVRIAIRRMVHAHARTMNGVDGWRIDADDIQDGVRLTVAHSKDVEKIRALGFAGVMARGAHHQQHHLMIARGVAREH